MSALSATIISNSVTLLVTSLTVSVLAAGEDTLPITVAECFKILTRTRSPGSESTAETMGVKESEPSSLTYLEPPYSTIVPYIGPVVVFRLLSCCMTSTNLATKSLDRFIIHHPHNFAVNFAVSVTLHPEEQSIDCFITLALMPFIYALE